MRGGKGHAVAMSRSVRPYARASRFGQVLCDGVELRAFTKRFRQAYLVCGSFRDDTACRGQTLFEFEVQGVSHLLVDGFATYQAQ